jgi:hypothetical protein
VGDGEKLLTYLNSVLKVLSGLDIFPRGTKKSEILLTSVIIEVVVLFRCLHPPTRLEDVATQRV